MALKHIFENLSEYCAWPDTAKGFLHFIQIYPLSCESEREISFP